jgi:threonine synthase
MTDRRSTLIDLACSRCEAAYPADRLQNLCPDCARPLLARYKLASAARLLTLDVCRNRPPGFGAYAELLPFGRPPVSLGEGRTPLVRAERLDRSIGGAEVWIRDEGVNPTGSFKARGLATAVNRASELGARGVALPTAGNAGLALAAYAAACGLGARVVCPADTPRCFILGARLLGAEVEEYPGLIDACGARVAELCAEFGLFDCSTLKEPYRVEGKKTMGLDMVRDMDSPPDVVVYPTGGGTGIVGIWKAFDEMESIGWTDGRRPRLVAVQAEGCAPLVSAFHAGAEKAAPWTDARTLASGLRVPRAVGDMLVLAALRASDGTALTVSDAEMTRGAASMGAASGVLAAPEGGATLAAACRLAAEGWIREGERVLLMNTGTALSYAEAFLD